MVRSYCFCGTQYYNNSSCASGRGCPRVELSNGSWSATLNKLNDMEEEERQQCNPHLRMRALRERFTSRRGGLAVPPRRARTNAPGALGRLRRLVRMVVKHSAHLRGEQPPQLQRALDHLSR
eukprot:1936709-Karenia_brevis.AAC.1